MLLFPPYTASTEWSGLITLDPTLATRIAASAGTVIDHSGQYKRLPQVDKGAVIHIPLSEVFKVRGRAGDLYRIKRTRRYISDRSIIEISGRLVSVIVC